MQDFEKLGVFYLGREFNLQSKTLQDNLLLYDSRDLVTHAVVMGMTGSGKTGLCIDLIEEAAIDGIPAILIDPKGDLTNLMLTFPQLTGNVFQPWVNPDDAARKGMSVEDFANQQAALWQKGLGDWGQNADRIQRLKNAADFSIFTPGSNAGIPVSILKSFAVPPFEIMDDGELLQERINITVTSLLGLLNIQADAMQSREHILISMIISDMWQQGKDVDLAGLITQIQNPPFTKIGVLDLESFYPSKDRFSLVMAMNNLLASPGFRSWLEGVPLDIGQILHTQQGKPRIAIFSIAHLSDNERMFFVSLILNQVLGWMRTQPGTTSLRALVYMDEIFGYFPPISNPPSKQPLLTLLKQARAFGVGIVLATQNPVDLDYKGLSNTGTWFIGRLQTERDKARVLEGLEGAASSAGNNFDRLKLDEVLAGLGNRVFLMNNTHEDAPIVFQTRWSLSYLRGPLTRSQIKQIMDPIKSSQPQGAANVQSTSGAMVGDQAPQTAIPVSAKIDSQTTVQTLDDQQTITTPQGSSPSDFPPSLPAEISQFYIPLRGSSNGVNYDPVLVGAAKIHYLDAKSLVDFNQSVLVLTEISDSAVPVDWEASKTVDVALNDLEKTPTRGVKFGSLPSPAAKAKNYAAWIKDFTTWLYGSQKIDLMVSPSTGKVAKPGENERDFRIRLQQAAREQRDEAVQALKTKYAVKINSIQEKIRKADQAVEREASQANQAKMATALSFGSTLLGAFTGRKLVSSANINKAASAFKGVGRSMQQQSDVDRAKDTVETYKQQLTELDEQFKAETEAFESKIDPMTETLDTITIRPKKTDISVQLCTLVWAPYRLNSQGQKEPAW